MEVTTFTAKRPLCLFWSEVEKWAPTSNRLCFEIIPDGWQLLPVSKFASKIENKEKVDPKGEYQMAGVRWYGEGVFHRETVLGKEQSATYLYPLKSGCIIYNRLFAWKESFAVIPEDLNGFYVSNEFPQFAIDRTIALPKYIYLLFITKKVISAVNAVSIGSAAVSRNRFKESDFLDFKVPIPPLPIQRKIVAYWETAQSSILAAKARVAEIEKETQKRFLSDLGLPKPKRTTPPKSFAVSWKGFERWSVSYNQAAMSMIDLSLGRYPFVELGTILEMVQYGTSEKANTTEKGTPVLRMNNIKDGYLDFSILKHVLLPEKNRESLLLLDGDILFNRTNSKELVGKCAVFHSSDEYVFASYLIRVRARKEYAIPDFVAYCINSVIGRQQINALSRQIIGQANINSQELRSLQLPLPPVDVQKEIIKRIEAGRIEIIQQMETVNNLLYQTQIDIENMILGTKSVEEI